MNYALSIRLNEWPFIERRKFSSLDEAVKEFLGVPASFCPVLELMESGQRDETLLTKAPGTIFAHKKWKGTLEPLLKSFKGYVEWKFN
jgi:hypothetical protein